MGIHDTSIDALLAVMPQKKRNRLRQRILRLMHDFEHEGKPPPGGNVKSIKDRRYTKDNGVVRLIR